jgi:hypothetical protein
MQQLWSSCSSRLALTILANHTDREYRTKTHGENAPETADLYFAYGKALLENAISQATVLGKEQPEDGVDATEGKGVVDHIIFLCLIFTRSLHHSFGIRRQRNWSHSFLLR